jgi:hypothetical protein
MTAENTFAYFIRSKRESRIISDENIRGLFDLLLRGFGLFSTRRLIFEKIINETKYIPAERMMPAAAAMILCSVFRFSVRCIIKLFNNFSLVNIKVFHCDN